MWLKKSVGRWVVGAVLLACGVGIAGARSASAQSTPVLLLLDPTTFDFGPAPHLIPSEAANELIGNVGLRDRIPYFDTRVGDTVTLPGGDGLGNDGWFAIRSVPPSWESEPGSGDGLENFWLAGPGLGSPDEGGIRTSLLNNVADVVPLRTGGVSALLGRTVCAIVFDHDVAVVAGTPAHADLSGSSLGVAAFEVVSVDGAGEWPSVTVRILDSKETCSGSLTPFSEAPDPFAAP
jgi:hypothetical protein